MSKTNQPARQGQNPGGTGAVPAAVKPAERGPKRICILLPRFSNYGGAEQFGVRLATSLAERGYAVDFICSRREIPAPAGVKVIVTGRPGGPLFLKNLWFCLQAEKLRKQGQYDCVVSLGKSLNQDILRVGGGPLRTFWKLSSASYPKGLSRMWKGLRRRLAPNNRLTLFLEKRQYSGNTRIIAVSHLVRDWIVEDHPNLAAKDIDLVYNKPDLERYHAPLPAERLGARVFFNMPEDAFVIGTASSNFRLKGVETLVRALPMLPENYRLYVAGGRNHGEYDELAKRLGVFDRVCFLGVVDRMAEFYHALDLFALPTFYDACSNAVLEALASGLPVLSSKTNGSAFFLKSQQVLENTDDPQEVAEKILRLGKKSPQGQFKWPANLQTGVDGAIAVIEDFLSKKERKK